MASGRSWLCCAPVALIALDVGLTLAGQPPEYWQGQYQTARELNPPARWALSQHPALFAAAGLLWAGAVSALVLRLPRGLARAAALGVVCGHTAGAASWLVAGGAAGCALAALLFALAYRLLGWSWRREAQSISRADTQSM
jgi:hypothetical protein